LLGWSNGCKRIRDTHAINNFTYVHVFVPDHAAACGVGAGKNNRIKECKAASLVQAQTSTNDGGSDLHHFKLFIEIELRSHILRWKFELLVRNVLVC